MKSLHPGFVGMVVGFLVIAIFFAFAVPVIEARTHAWGNSRRDAMERGGFHRFYCESYCEGVGGVVLQDAELLEVRVTVGAGELSQVECLCGIILVDPE